jgi:SAM-dependent methyltransferase
LVFAVPVRPGDRVAVVGPHPGIIDAVRLLAAHPISVLGPTQRRKADLGEIVRGEGDGRLPLAGASVDHVIVPRLGVPLAAAADELARVVRRGGHVVVVAANRWAAPRDPLAVGSAGGSRLLRGAGFTDVVVHAIPQLDSPRHLVPVASRAAHRWYLRSAFPAATRKDAAVAGLAQLLSLPPTVGLILSALGFSARRADGRRS